jgi:putative Holliday junction resolvase
MLYCVSIKDFHKKLEKGKALLGVDCGTRKIGVSISDPNLVISMPHSIIQCKTAKEGALALKKVIDSKSLWGVVLGYPLDPMGNEGPTHEVVKDIIKELEKIGCEMPYFLQDERFTTKFAIRTLEAQNPSKKGNDGMDDSLAASYILQTTLDLIRNSS